ncbi:MAG: hypothetical protein PVI97_00255 [Candidatus Thiodiazotropha sp.]
MVCAAAVLIESTAVVAIVPAAVFLSVVALAAAAEADPPGAFRHTVLDVGYELPGAGATTTGVVAFNIIVSVIYASYLGHGLFLRVSGRGTIAPTTVTIIRM